MKKRDFLLEIGVEELPARFITGALTQLKEKIEGWLKDERLGYEAIDVYSTPRRLVVLIHGLDEKQQDLSEEAKGPAKKIAIDEEGHWTKAAEGFARGQGVETSELFFKELKGVEYVYANKHVSGKETRDILPEVKEIIIHLHFPQNMRWGSNQLKFARPIQWLVALYGEEVIPFSIADIHTDKKTLGHRFLGGEAVITKPSEYAELLKQEYVLVDQAKRKQMIQQQIEAIASENGWVIPIDTQLLDEVTNLVEYPTALFGSFDDQFLQLPREVLITSMREHQRYFPVENKEGKLLPHFVTVRNGNKAHLDNVTKGNEKVLRARLADGAFFYEEDQKLNIDDALERLEQIVYHEDLGSVGDKVRRIMEGVSILNERLHVDPATADTANRVARICKFDLVSQMVDEFPELQGRMGEVYAELAGESAEVSKAIFEHYKPRFSGDESPGTLAGTLVSIMDKLDTIVACFSIGLIPTGSQDPYALRRQAAGIIHMLDDHKLDIEVEQLIEIGLAICEDKRILTRSREEVFTDLVEFFKLRVKAFLQEEQIKYDVIDAVLAGSIGHLPTLLKKAQLITEKRNEESFKHIIEALSRVTNIAKKVTDKKEINQELFEKEEERVLYSKYVEVNEIVKAALTAGEVDKAFEALASCEPAINNYFDHIMVMAEDENVKANRLALMSSLSEVIRSFAQFQAIVFS